MHVLLVFLLIGTTACAGLTAASARQRQACIQLEREPSSLLEKMVARPDEFPYEVWSQAHPEAPRGSLLKAEVKKVIEAHLAEVRTCYEDALQVWPNAAGRVIVRFGISPSGVVDASTVVSNNTGVKPLACCIATAVRGWRFRAPDGGGPVIVTYPFNLEVAP